MSSSNSEVSGSGRIIILTVLVIFIIGVITGVIIYADRVAPFRAPVLKVNDAEVSMGYFLKRAARAFGEPAGVLQTLIAEEIIKQVVPKIPYSIKVTEADVETYMREIAAASLELDEGATISENEFESWYRQEVELSGLTNAEFREKLRVDLFRAGLISYLADRIPTVAEQVKLYAITVGSVSETQRVMERLDAGEDFLKVAEELEANDLLIVPEVEIGWRPRSALSASFASVAFDQLEVGEHSEPLVAGQQYYTVVKVADRARARQVDEEVLAMQKASVFDNWLLQEVARHNIAIHGVKNGYDEETRAWVSWQLQKMRRRD